MNHLTGSDPTTGLISREVLHLDAYGMCASKIVEEHGVAMGAYISKQPDLLNPLIDYMAGEGWLFSGSGFFSAVFVKDGLAVKFGFKPSDTGAMYAAWCRANQGLAGVPTIYSLTKFKHVYVVLTRQYDRIPEEQLDDEDEHFNPDLYAEYDAVRQAVNRGLGYHYDRFDTVQTGLAIHQFFDGIVDFDLHEANIMMDLQGNVIITDPIGHGPCSSAGYTYYYTTANP